MAKEIKTLAQKMREELRYLVVMDYGEAEIIIRRVPKSWDSEDIEAFIFGDEKDQLGFKESEIDWMLAPKLNIRME